MLADWTPARRRGTWETGWPSCLGPPAISTSGEWGDGQCTGESSPTNRHTSHEHRHSTDMSDLWQIIRMSIIIFVSIYRSSLKWQIYIMISLGDYSRNSKHVFVNLYMSNCYSEVRIKKYFKYGRGELCPVLTWADIHQICVTQFYLTVKRT